MSAGTSLVSSLSEVLSVKISALAVCCAARNLFTEINAMIGFLVGKRLWRAAAPSEFSARFDLFGPFSDVRLLRIGFTQLSVREERV